MFRKPKSTETLSRIPMTGIDCCARAVSGRTTAAPPSSATNSRRPMPDMGGPSLRDCRKVSLPQSGRPVIGGDLNRSETGGGRRGWTICRGIKNIKSLKYLGPKTVFGQVFGAGVKTDYENLKAPPGGSHKPNNLNRGG